MNKHCSQNIEMYAARIFNERENRHLPFIYGAVITGNEWKFIKLVENLVYIDKD